MSWEALEEMYPETAKEPRAQVSLRAIDRCKNAKLPRLFGMDCVLLVQGPSLLYRFSVPLHGR